MMNAIRWIKQFAEKITAMCVAPIRKRQKLSMLQRHTVWHGHCHWINNVNSSPQLLLIIPQAVVLNNCAVFKNWSDDAGIPN